MTDHVFPTEPEVFDGRQTLEDVPVEHRAMTRDEAAATLAEIERRLTQRIVIVREVVTTSGEILMRIIRKDTP